jgi:glycosyltransferase involved in cell wall biosynthesis
VINVLHVVDSLERGGLERVVADLALAQLAAGHVVNVFCLYRRGAFAADLQAAGIGVACGDKRDGLDLRALWRLRCAASSWGCNVVHAHNLVPNYYSALATLGAFKAPVLVDTCHDMGTRLSNRHLRRMYCWSLSRTARVAMVAEQVHERYVGGGLVVRERARTIFNGIPVQRFIPTAQRRLAAREALALPADAIAVGCVGRLVPLKNHQLIIAALPALLSAYPTLQLVLIGGGELDSKLRDQANQLGVAHRVVFAGERADVADLLPAFDIFALPSLTEGLSIALLEAASTGLAIVATAVGGNPKVIKDGETGLLVAVQDAAALTAALRRLLDDNTLRIRLGTAAMAWAHQNAAIDTTRAAYDDLYREALRDRGSSRPSPSAANRCRES